MSLTTKKGVITHLAQSTSTFGNNGNVRSTQSYTFRIDGVPASIQATSQIGIHENDTVTVVGEIKKGTLKAYGLKNHTTGAIIKDSAILHWIAGICFTCLGVLTLVFLIGFVLLPIGIYMIYSGIKYSRANKILDAL